MQPTHTGAPAGTQGLIDAGTRALNANRLDEAISYLCGAARASPTNGHIWMMLGIAYLRRGMANEAMTTLITATQLWPSSADARHYLGMAYERSGYAAEAVQQYRYALQIAPSHHEARQALGRISPGLQLEEQARVAGVGATHGGSEAPHPGDERAAAIMAQTPVHSKQRQDGSARLRRGLMIAGLCVFCIMALSVMCVPLLIRSCRGSPKEVVCQYLEAKYIRHDDEAARLLTVESSMPREAFSESADVISEDTPSGTALQSYAVGEPTVQGNHAQVPVDMTYVDAAGQTQQETIQFVAIARGPVWRVSLMQSMGGSRGDGPPPDPSGDSGSCFDGGGGFSTGGG